MSVRTFLLGLSACLSISACLSPGADDGDEARLGDVALATASSAAIVINDPPIAQYPVPPSQSYYAENWAPRVSPALTWPTNATRVQVIIRRGHAATLYSPATFYAFIVSDGSHLRRILHVATSDYGAFLAHMNSVYAIAEAPNSERSHSIAGGTYVGPHPAGPPGDPISPTLLSRVLTSAAAIDNSAQLAINESF
jgi:hypothetical protein